MPSFISTKHENLFSWLAKKCHKNSKIVNIKNLVMEKRKKEKKGGKPQKLILFIVTGDEIPLSLIEVFI